jgi:L-ribulose-5-phosphate 3-epimerase
MYTVEHPIMIDRRRFLASALAPAAAAFAKPKASSGKWDRTRLSAVTDEIATSPAGAISFAKLYDLKWLEVRAVPGAGGEYAQLNTEALKVAAKEFADNGIGISFLNTGMLKYWLPGSQFKPGRLSPADAEKRKERDTKRFADRMKYLDDSIRAAHILGVRDVRVFAFSRTDEPEQNFQRIAEVLGEYALRAEKEGIRLLLENEVSCNVATCAETAKMIKMVPSKALGINWDAMNGEDLKEAAYPTGYALLPKDKLWNVQVKGKSLMEEAKKIDWATVFAALQKDGYQGRIGLETHMFGRMLFTHSHYCMREMIRIVEHA